MKGRNFGEPLLIKAFRKYSPLIHPLHRNNNTEGIVTCTEMWTLIERSSASWPLLSGMCLQPLRQYCHAVSDEVIGFFAAVTDLTDAKADKPHLRLIL